MYRNRTCGELRLADAGQTVTLAGWVQRTRKMGGMTFVDIRDRYGITQVVFNNEINRELTEAANTLGREFVVQVTGKVEERSSKNSNLPTGDIEVIADTFSILNRSEVDQEEVDTALLQGVSVVEIQFASEHPVAINIDRTSPYG